MKMSKIKTISSIVFLWLYIVNFANAELTLIELYGLNEVSALETLIKNEQPMADTPEEKKRIGIAWHNLAVEEVSGAAEKAVEILKPLTKEIPKDYVVLSYLGSSQTMVGRDSWNPLTKMTAVNKGIALVDKAIVKDRDNVTTRLVRIYSSLGLPDFLGRGGKIKTDLEYLVKLIKKTDVTTLAQSEIYFLMGEFFMKEGEADLAKTNFEKAIKVDPKNIWALKAKDSLND